MEREKNTKDRIFYASAELFAEKSFSRVSIRDIAEKVGIKSSSLYNHYKSKDEILNEILDHYVKRIAQFYNEYLEEASQPDYKPSLMDTVYVYKPEEVQLMFWITRIVYTEQFTSEVVADTLIGASNQRYTGGTQMFFEKLVDMGVIKDSKNCVLYTELFSRLSHSFQRDFVHPEFVPVIKDLRDMYRFVFKLILAYEGSLDRYGELAGPEQSESPE